MRHAQPEPGAGQSEKTCGWRKKAIRAGARVRVYPYGAITVGQRGEELSDLEGMAESVVAFSDDGHGVQDGELMERAMLRAKALDKLIVAHCEVNALLTKGGCIHDGRWARAYGFPGISSESEWRMVERDIGLVRKTGCRYHVCHISTEESVMLIRQAKAEGLPVTCETAPHYLLLCEDDLQDEGRFKMNPPVRSSQDRDALLDGLLDGTIDCIATDHAPHSAEEKAKGLRGSAFGIVGLETALPTALYESGGDRDCAADAAGGGTLSESAANLQNSRRKTGTRRGRRPDGDSHRCAPCHQPRRFPLAGTRHALCRLAG
jgi:dihydroorotase